MRLFRDEMANMAWAVERVVTSRGGRALDRHDIYYARNGHGASQGAGGRPASVRTRSAFDGGRLAYRLMSRLPDYWIPLVPVPFPAGGTGAIRLQRGVVPDPVTGAPVPPQGRILGTGPLAIHDEESRAPGRG